MNFYFGGQFTGGSPNRHWRGLTVKASSTSIYHASGSEAPG